jgi:TPR repeat protein
MWQIFSFLDEDLANTKFVNKQWHDVSSDERLLRRAYRKGLEALRNGQYQEAKKLIFASAEILSDGDLRTIYNTAFKRSIDFHERLGSFTGLQFFDELRSLFKKSAKKNNPVAQKLLGDIYFHGIGGYGAKKSAEKAFEYYDLAARQGYVPALLRRAHQYINGQGVPKDEEKGLQDLKFLADQGKQNAQMDLGGIYMHGQTGSRDLEVAKKYFQLAANSGNKWAKMAIDSIDRIQSGE